MKKKLMSFLLALLITAAVFVPNAMAQDNVNLAVELVQGNASQMVNVNVVAKADIDVNTAKIKIDYDTNLELVSVTNGTALAQNESLSVLEQDRGSYVLLVSNTNATQNAYLSDGTVLCTLTFKLPSTTGTYSVSVDNARTELYSANGTKTTCVASAGGVTVNPLTSACQTHTFGADVVVNATATYLVGAYSYKTCTTCGYVESTLTNPTATGILTPIGTIIKYAGNPSGIGAHYGVNKEAITAVETAGFKVSIGMVFEYGTRTERYHFYGDDVSPENSLNLEDGVISAAIERVHTQLGGAIYAYVEIIDPSTGFGRIEKCYMHLNGDYSLSIKDIASVLNMSKYSQSTVDYLTAVISGGTYEDREYE